MIYIIMSIIFLYCLNTHTFSRGVISSEDYKSIEIDMNQLFNNFINLFIDEKNTFEINDILYNRKIHQLNFEETVQLYKAAVNQKNKKYILNSLEHMYVTAPDAKAAELILYKLGSMYIFYKKYEHGLLAFSQFKALFPGSKYYEDSLKKEIECVSNLCLSIYHDDTMGHRLIESLNTYDEKIGLEGNADLVDLYYKGYSVTVGKKLYYLNHYMDKYLYTFDYSSVYSSLFELNSLKNELEAVLELEYEFNGKEVFAYFYEDIINFFEKHPIVIPDGKEFIVLKKDLDVYIEKNYKQIRDDIKIIIKNYNRLFRV